MNAYPTSKEVLEDLGEKVQHVLGTAVALTRNDLEDYRKLRPDWVARHGERGLANWISDQLWHHITVGLDSVDDAETREEGVVREVSISDRYRLRIKRHHVDGTVSTYPTQMALDFLEQPSNQLPGLEQVHLISGYEWDRQKRSIVRPVLSLRDSKDNLIWLVGLPGDETGIAITSGLPPLGGPTDPGIVLGPGLSGKGGVEERP